MEHPTPDDFTASIVARATCYVRFADPEETLRRAYGDRAPGSGRRWLDQAEERTCGVEGCSDRHSARGLCHKHYERVRRTGRVELVRPEPRPSPTPEEIRDEMVAALDRVKRVIEG